MQRVFIVNKLGCLSLLCINFVEVTEARAKSGTLITVDTGLEQGKEIYAVPGRVTDRLSDGCNYLIKQGAGVILSPKEFLGEVWELWERKQERTQGTPLFAGRKCGTCQELRGAEEAGEEAGEEKDALRRSLRKYKGGEDRTDAILQELPQELADIYGVLDSSNPKNVAGIGSALMGKYRDLQISTHLMRLCMEKRAVQVSPGQFCRVES